MQLSLRFRRPPLARCNISTYEFLASRSVSEREQRTRGRKRERVKARPKIFHIFRGSIFAASRVIFPHCVYTRILSSFSYLHRNTWWLNRTLPCLSLLKYNAQREARVNHKMCINSQNFLFSIVVKSCAFSLQVCMQIELAKRGGRGRCELTTLVANLQNLL